MRPPPSGPQWRWVRAAKAPWRRSRLETVLGRDGRPDAVPRIGVWRPCDAGAEEWAVACGECRRAAELWWRPVPAGLTLRVSAACSSIRTEERGRRGRCCVVATGAQVERSGPQRCAGDQRGGDVQAMSRRKAPVPLAGIRIAIGRRSELVQADESLLGGCVERHR